MRLTPGPMQTHPYRQPRLSKPPLHPAFDAWAGAQQAALAAEEELLCRYQDCLAGRSKPVSAIEFARVRELRATATRLLYTALDQLERASATARYVEQQIRTLTRISRDGTG